MNSPATARVPSIDPGADRNETRNPLAFGAVLIDDGPTPISPERRNFVSIQFERTEGPKNGQSRVSNFCARV